MNIPGNKNSNNGFNSPSSFSATTSNASYSQSPGSITNNSSIQTSSSVSRNSTLQNKINYQERRQSVLGIVNGSQQLPFSKDTVKLVKIWVLVQVVQLNYLLDFLITQHLLLKNSVPNIKMNLNVIMPKDYR